MQTVVFVGFRCVQLHMLSIVLNNDNVFGAGLTKVSKKYKSNLID